MSGPQPLARIQPHVEHSRATHSSDQNEYTFSRTTNGLLETSSDFAARCFCFSEWLLACCRKHFPTATPGNALKEHKGMRRSQGRYFSAAEIERIKSLLASTDLTLQEIAIRMRCAKSSIVSINQHFQIRDYRGRRSDWAVSK